MMCLQNVHCENTLHAVQYEVAGIVGPAIIREVALLLRSNFRGSFVHIFI